MRATTAIEQIEDRQRLVHANQRLAVRRYFAASERQMRGIGQLIAERHQFEVALGGADGSLANALHQPLGLTAVVNQLRYRADFQAMRAREFDEIRKARHRAVIFENLANNRRRREPSEMREIASRLGVPCA